MHKRIHLQTWHSPNGHTLKQIDYCLIDGRHLSGVIDVKARRGANIDSDHMLVVIKLRARICRASKTKPQQLRRFVVDRLKDRDVASRYYDEPESELQGVQAQPLFQYHSIRFFFENSMNHKKGRGENFKNCIDSLH
jgi:hypothetical protein